MESKSLSFTGEASSGRWGIGENIKHLRGNQFYWLCDCCDIK